MRSINSVFQPKTKMEMGMTFFNPRHAARFSALCLSVSFACAAMPGTAGAVDFVLGVQQRYSQTSFQIPSTGTTTVYRGLGYEGELRLRFKGSQGGIESSSGLAIDAFTHFLYSSESNPAAPLGESYANIGLGGGLDFRLGMFFVGMQLQENLTTISTTQGTLNLGFLSYGFRTGVEFNLNKGGNLLVDLGALIEMGQTPATSTGIWLGSCYTGFATLGWHAF